MKGRKGSTDEGGVRSPCFIRWPARLAAGKTVNEIAGALDLLPTLARLAGVARVGDLPLDGRDLSPLLFGTTRDWPERLIFSAWANRVSVRSPRYRLDDRGALFDLENDPRQEADIAAQQAEVASRLSTALATWRKEMFPAGQAAGIRPIPVGYAEFPRATLTAGDGVPHGGVRRSNRFPNSTYFTNWTSTDDTMTWDIEVNQPGNYAVTLDYTCAAGDVGSTIELEFHGARLAGRVSTAWDPPLLDGEDRNVRQESFLKEFRPLPLGTLRLEKGRGLLTLRATRITGQAVIDVRNLTLAIESP
jgi:hypothetical protein